MNVPTLPKLSSDRVMLCLCLSQARTADYPLMAASAGFDAIYVDLQHTVMPLDVASMLCIAAAGAGMLPLVRVASHDPEILTRALDGGARGLIVPHVDTAEDARRIVEICRFPPVGERGVIGPNPVNFYNAASMAEAVAYCEQQTVIAVMLESGAAIADADAIAAVEGVDMLLIGAFDLSTDLGIMGEFTNPKFRAAIAGAAAACAAHGKTLGLAGVADTAMLGDFVEMGVRFISGGTDWGLFMTAANQRVAALRGISDKVGPRKDA